MSPTANADTGESYGGDVFGAEASGLGAEPWLLELTANHPNMRAVVTQMMGGPIRMCQRTRGVYTIWPTTDHEERTVGGHNDGRPGQLSAMVLAGDVLPHCGGFHVWPGAPKRLYPLWQVRSPALPRPRPSVATAMKARSDGRGLRRRRRGTRRVLSRRRSTSWRSRRCATQYRRRRSSARPGTSASGCAPLCPSAARGPRYS